MSCNNPMSGGKSGNSYVVKPSGKKMWKEEVGSNKTGDYVRSLWDRRTLSGRNLT